MTGDFAQTNNCSATVPAGSSYVIQITFTPTASRTRSGSLILKGNAQSPQTLSLSGVGLDFTLASSTNIAIAEPGASATYQLTVAPLGAYFTNVVKPSCSGLPAQTTCSSSPSAVTPGGRAASATVTLDTTASLTGVTRLHLFDNGPLHHGPDDRSSPLRDGMRAGGDVDSTETAIGNSAWNLQHYGPRTLPRSAVFGLLDASCPVSPHLSFPRNWAGLPSMTFPLEDHRRHFSFLPRGGGSTQGAAAGLLARLAGPIGRHHQQPSKLGTTRRENVVMHFGSLNESVAEVTLP